MDVNYGTSHIFLKPLVVAIMTELDSVYRRLLSKDCN